MSVGVSKLDPRTPLEHSSDGGGGTIRRQSLAPQHSIAFKKNFSNIYKANSYLSFNKCLGSNFSGFGALTNFLITEQRHEVNIPAPCGSVDKAPDSQWIYKYSFSHLLSKSVNVNSTVTSIVYSYILVQTVTQYKRNAVSAVTSVGPRGSPLVRKCSYTAIIAQWSGFLLPPPTKNSWLRPTVQ